MEIKSNFILPFKLPIKDGLIQISSYDFAELHTEYATVSEGVDIEFNNVKHLRTQMTITYFPHNGIENEEDSTSILHYFVVNSLYHINKVIDGLKLLYGLQFIDRITVRDLPTSLIIYINGEGYVYLTNTDMLREDILIEDAKEFTKLGSILTSVDMYPEIYLVDMFYESAKTALHQEKFTNFIIDIQTSFEIFIRNSLRLILIKENQPKQKIKKTDGYPFKNIIEQHLKKYLKEPLDFKDHPQINEWYTKIYLKRNAIVHEGYMNITGEEANNAIEAYEKTRIFINDLLIREGYLDSDGKVDLKLFEKNNFDSEKSNKLFNNMIQRGLINPDIKLITPNL